MILFSLYIQYELKNYFAFPLVFVGASSVVSSESTPPASKGSVDISLDAMVSFFLNLERFSPSPIFSASSLS